MAYKEYEAKIIGFFCNWCTYAGADLAGADGGAGENRKKTLKE